MYVWCFFRYTRQKHKTTDRKAYLRCSERAGALCGKHSSQLLKAKIKPRSGDCSAAAQPELPAAELLSSHPFHAEQRQSRSSPTLTRATPSALLAHLQTEPARCARPPPPARPRGSALRPAAAPRTSRLCGRAGSALGPGLCAGSDTTRTTAHAETRRSAGKPLALRFRAAAAAQHPPRSPDARVRRGPPGSGTFPSANAVYVYLRWFLAGTSRAGWQRRSGPPVRGRGSGPRRAAQLSAAGGAERRLAGAG